MLFNDYTVAYSIFDGLQTNGYTCYCVGGFVRNLIMDNNRTTDIDLTTNATPEQVKEIFSRKQYSHIKIVETGLKHGTLTLYDGISVPVEITTYRTDGEYTDGRRPDSVEFVDDIALDLARRDFTMNAIASDNDGNLVDLYGGEKHIKSRTICCVGNPDTRFKEDGLRILRALRFASQMGFTIEKETSEAIFRNKYLLLNVSQERIIKEFTGILRGKDCINVLNEYKDIIAVFIPELKPLFDCSQNNRYHVYNVWEHTIVALYMYKNTNNFLTHNLPTQLALLFHDIGKPSSKTTDENGYDHFYGHAVASTEITKTILKRLRYKNNIINEVCNLIQFHDYSIAPTNKCARRFLQKIDDIDISLSDFEAMRISDMQAHNLPHSFQRIADFKTFIECVRDIKRKDNCFSVKKLAVNGNDIIALGIPQGEQVGSILKQLLEDVIEKRVVNEKPQLLKQVGKNLSLI